MKIVLVSREEAMTPTGIYTFDPSNPFDGMEVYEVLPDSHPEREDEILDRLEAIAAEHDGKWKFHIEDYDNSVQSEAARALDRREFHTRKVFSS